MTLIEAIALGALLCDIVLTSLALWRGCQAVKELRELRKEQSHRGRGISSFVVPFLLLLMVAPAIADGIPNPPHHHPPQDTAIHERFYSGWMRPDKPNESCCNLRDCAPAKSVRRIGNRWEAQRESDDAWVVVPSEKIEQRRDSPDGRSHLCSRGLNVFCFVAGSGT